MFSPFSPNEVDEEAIQVHVPPSSDTKVDTRWIRNIKESNNYGFHLMLSPPDDDESHETYARLQHWETQGSSASGQP